MHNMHAHTQHTQTHPLDRETEDLLTCMLWKLRTIEICKLIENNRHVTRAVTKSGLTPIQEPQHITQNSCCVSSHTMNYLKWCPTKLLLLEKHYDRIAQLIFPVLWGIYIVEVHVQHVPPKGKLFLRGYQYVECILNLEVVSLQESPIGGNNISKIDQSLKQL